MAKPKEIFNVTTHEGAVGASKEQQRLYDWMMAKTPTDRYNYLVNSGWNRLNKYEHKPEEHVIKNFGEYMAEERLADAAFAAQQHNIRANKPFVRITWEMPEHRCLSASRRWMNQTQALLCQIWWDLEDHGVIVRR